MGNKSFYIPLFLCVCLSLFQACDDDDFTTNPSHLLSFSQDTLMLDTVFTTIGTSTRIVKVYNRYKDALLISSIQLANAAGSGFRINVDGMKGTQFADVEIRGKDSLFIFVEATVDATSGNLPFLVKDSIVFQTNGVRQEIKLRAYGWNAHLFRGKVIDRDTTLTALRPILIYDSLSIAKEATLTLEEGVRLFFHSKAGMNVHGRLKVNGSIAHPVILRNDRTDNMLSDLPYDRLPGQWEGVRLYATSFENTLDYTEIRGAHYGILCDPSQTDRRKLTLTNSLITQMSGDALSLKSSNAVIANTEISNAGGNCVYILGGNNLFTHCTIANYYSWSVRKGTALSITNVYDDMAYPLEQASFQNCIVAGSSSDEVAIALSPDGSTLLDPIFSHTLANVENIDFRLIDKSLLLYDFRLAETSAAIDAGLLQYAVSYPVDRYGVSRVSDAAPDAGCYEWTGL